MLIFILLGVQQTVEIVNVKICLEVDADFNGDEFADFCLIEELGDDEDFYQNVGGENDEDFYVEDNIEDDVDFYQNVDEGD